MLYRRVMIALDRMNVLHRRVLFVPDADLTQTALAHTTHAGSDWVKEQGSSCCAHRTSVLPPP